MSRPTFSTAAFAQLVRRLYRANARCSQIARQFRRTYRPTYHAKRRAMSVGLRIDTTMARACPTSAVYTHEPAILTIGPPTDALDWADMPADGYATVTEPLIWPQAYDPQNADACMRAMPFEVVPEKIIRKYPGIDGHERVTLRLPPLRLFVDVDYQTEALFRDPVPGAPRLMPRQLPEDEYGGEDVTSSSKGGSDQFGVQVYSGLCITIPPRNLKRKLHEVESDEGIAYPRQAKRLQCNDSL